MVAIDGCQVACAKKILEHAEIPRKASVAVSGLEIENNLNINLKREAPGKVKVAVKEACNRLKGIESRSLPEGAPHLTFHGGPITILRLVFPPRAVDR